MKVPKSFEKFSYLLRPSKQVERKLMIEALHWLSAGGFHFREYRYLGLGSVYYADFLLFHRYLYLHKMTCVEAAPIPRRMEFNRPLKCIELKMGLLSEYLPQLRREEKHFAWLDYDSGVSFEMLADVAGIVQVVAEESIVVITADARPKLPDSLSGEWDDLNESGRAKRLLAHYREVLGPGIAPGMLSKAEFPGLVAKTLRSRLEGAARARGLLFFHLFNFSYADGAPMISVGGILGDKVTREKLKRSGILKWPFLGGSDLPLSISVPQLTHRERTWLEQNMPGKGSGAFELEDAELKNFKKFARYYPNYVEAIF